MMLRRLCCPASLQVPLPFADILQADVAILDEIDSGLDIDALRDVAKAVNGLRRDDAATIMVTHYKVGWQARTPFD